MKREDSKYWRDTIKNCEKFYRPKHDSWRRLIERYNLDLEVPGLADEFVVKISRFFPLVRKLIASIAFNYPRVFLQVEDEPFEDGSDILERFANEAIDTMEAKREIHQLLFDALFCFRGFLKIGYNTANTTEAQAPYVFNDALQEDFTFVKRISPFNVYVDPLVPPNDFSSALYVIEKMLVPLDFARNDPRFANHKRQFVALDDKGADTGMDDILMDFENGMPDTSEEEDAVKEAKRLQKVVLLYEIHDRVKKRRYVFANDIEDPVEDIEHPFLKREAITQPDRFNPAQQLMTGEFGAPEGWLTTTGFPYHSLSYDICDKFYGTPIMQYVNDPQQLVVESVSRRVDLLKKHARITLGNKAEQVSNANLPDDLSTLNDGAVLWVQDPNTAMREMSWGSPPHEQIQIERDALAYEAQILSVEARNSNTATEASITASEAQLNREWMQVAVVDTYKWIVNNALSIMSDQRYTPNSYQLNVAADGEPARLAALENFWLQGRRRVEIEAGSMLPLIEQLERDDTLGLFDRVIQLPEVDRGEALKMMIKSFRKVDPEQLLKDDVNTDASTAAQLEGQVLFSTGQIPPPLDGQDHNTHLQQHQSQLQQMQQAVQQGQIAEQIYQAMQQHIQMHVQMLQQAGGAIGAPSPGTEGPAGLQEQVASNAQKIAQSIQTGTRDASNTGQA